MERTSVTHSSNGLCTIFFCSYHILKSSVIYRYYWKNAKQHGIYLTVKLIQYVTNWGITYVCMYYVDFVNKVVLSTTCKQLGTKSLLLGLAFLHTWTGCGFHSLIQIIANVFTVAESFALTKIYSSEIHRKESMIMLILINTFFVKEKKDRYSSVTICDVCSFCHG